MSEPMRMMQSSLVGIALFGVVLSTACNKSQSDHRPTVAPAGGDAPPAKPLPDPELGEVFVVDEWTIQMPKGYGLQSQEQRDGAITAWWHGPAEDLAVGSRLFAIAFIHPSKGKQALTAAELRRFLLPALGLSEYQESEPEVVPIGNRNFERVLTTCRLDKSSNASRGFQYVSVGQPRIAMFFQGKRDDDESFREADAAARSLRQR